MSRRCRSRKWRSRSRQLSTRIRGWTSTSRPGPEAEVEEGFLTLTALPARMLLKVGKLRGTR